MTNGEMRLWRADKCQNATARIPTDVALATEFTAFVHFGHVVEQFVIPRFSWWLPRHSCFRNILRTKENRNEHKWWWQLWL